jgi:hypothetical protein
VIGLVRRLGARLRGEIRIVDHDALEATAIADLGLQQVGAFLARVPSAAWSAEARQIGA